MPQPRDTGLARVQAALLHAEAERAIEAAILSGMDRWLSALRYAILRDARAYAGPLVATGYYPGFGFHLDAAASEMEGTWWSELERTIAPAIGTAFGESFQVHRRAAEYSPYRWQLDYMAEVVDRLKIWPLGAFEELRPELIEAVAEAESFNDIRDRMGRILNIDADTRRLRADIGVVEKALDAGGLSPAREAALRARRAQLWNAHDESLGEWQWRARRIARTEAHGAVNGGALDAARAQVRAGGEPLFKRWLATGDRRVRPSHAVADGQIVPLDQKFRVGGYLLDHPADSSEVAPHEVINCRCAMAVMDYGQMQEELQGARGSAGEIRSGGIRIGPDDPDMADDAIRTWSEEQGRDTPRLGLRGEDRGQQVADIPSPEVDPGHEVWDPMTGFTVDLSGVSDDELSVYLANYTHEDAAYSFVAQEARDRLGYP